MRKIGFVEYSAVLALSAALGIIFSSVLIYTSQPLVSAKADVPSIDYDKISAHKGGVIMGQSPFKSMGPMLPEAPVPPDIPQMPADSSDRLVVIGLLPPDVCIIRKGADTITARSGESTKLGQIGQITEQGAYVDGTFIEIQ